MEFVKGYKHISYEDYDLSYSMTEDYRVTEKKLDHGLELLRIFNVKEDRLIRESIIGVNENPRIEAKEEIKEYEIEQKEI